MEFLEMNNRQIQNSEFYTKAVVIGRFEPVMHTGHISMIRKALEVAKEVYILIGSASAFPDVKNPISADLRQRCIWAILHEEFTTSECSRIKTRYINDYKYNDEKWKTEVRTEVQEFRFDKITMVGFEKDEDSYWLREFGWKLTPVEPTMVSWLGNTVPMSSTFIRDHWLRTGEVKLQDMLHPVAIDFLNKFTWTKSMEFTSAFERLNEERLKWDKEIKKFEAYPYMESLHGCCADAVVICNNHIALIERKFAPGKGALALPGGHKNSNETFRFAALRELEEETGLKVPPKVLRGSILDQHLFDDPKRTAVFCKPTVAQYIVIQPDHDGKLPKMVAADDAKKAKWVPLHEVKRNPQLLFDDHSEIISYFTGI